MKRFLVVSALVAVVAIAAVAGLSLSKIGASTTTTTHDPVYVGRFGASYGGVNSTTIWGTVVNAGNGTLEIIYHFVRHAYPNAPVIANQTDTLSLAPGQNVTLSIQGSYQSGSSGYESYQFVVVGSGCGINLPCGESWFQSY